MSAIQLFAPMFSFFPKQVMELAFLPLDLKRDVGDLIGCS